jgi:ankyrin repeat protein
MNFLKTLFKPQYSMDAYCNALVKGDLDSIKRMLTEDPQLINKKNERDMTPLHIAVQLNRMEVAAVLIELGADINAQSDKGVTPLQCATSIGNKKMADYLKKYGARMN